MKKPADSLAASEWKKSAEVQIVSEATKARQVRENTSDAHQRITEDSK